MAYRKPQFLLFCLSLIYLVIKFGFSQWLDSLGEYSSYIFELALVLMGFFFYSHQSNQNEKSILKLIKINRRILFALPFSLLFGFMIFKLGTRQGISIPFDFNQTELLFFLILVAPILEELLFRFFLWQGFKYLHVSGKFLLVTTSLLFSYSHLHALWLLPADFHPFIWFQTLYTLLLGFICGSIVLKYRSVLGAILIHFTFNLGFYLGSFSI